MCGICGVLNLNSEPVTAQVVEKMAELISHRGPDEHGVHIDGPVGLGHRRLSIIDVGCGQQPMCSADGNLWISFNGEIFNYVELRKDLEQRGHRFRTQSDTEVILHLYEEEGEECVQHFNGQWAFAIWDKKNAKLFLSRDRLGVRPLFYTRKNETFIFASEMKAIFAYPGVQRDIDLIGLDQVFTFWCTLAPRTTFKDIWELPPGHNLAIEAGKTRIWTYWRLNYPLEYAKFKEEDWAAKLLELLTDATRIRLRSDVPVGTYLSGGLDSTVVTSIIRRHSTARLKSFSIVFDNPEFDERRYQREAVSFLGTEHHEVAITGADIARVFPKVIWHTEKPILRSAPAPLYLLSALVRNQGYKVVLSGEGADEILGGYDIFKEAKIRRFWGRQPASRLRPLLLKRLYPYLGNVRSQPQSYLAAFFHVGARDLSNPLFSHLPRWELTSRLKSFFSEDVRAGLRDYSAMDEIANSLPPLFENWDHFTQSQYLESSCLFPGYILSSQGDRMGMAHSVEGRFPFLDHRVVEFAMHIPPECRMKVLNEKHVLKKAAVDLIPASVRSRSKQPYRAPDSASFFPEGKATEPYVEEMLAPSHIRHSGIFNSTMVSKLYDKIRAGQVIGTKDNMALLGILSTQLLIFQFIENR
jgi:asparagine synthase (glutamine-hydrolysing)